MQSYAACAVVFPFLFINAENGRLQRQVEQLTDVELGTIGVVMVGIFAGLVLDWLAPRRIDQLSGRVEKPL